MNDCPEHRVDDGASVQALFSGPPGTLAVATALVYPNVFSA
jgi:hypothetical protein